MSNVKKVLIILLSLVLVDLVIIKYVESPNLVRLKNFIIPSSGLEKVVRKVLSGTRGTYSVVIKNLKTGESYYLEEKKQFEAGSLYKIWILSETMNQLQKGRIKENEVLSEEIVVLNKAFDISSESAELTEGTLEITVSNAIRQMVAISHNYSALILSKKIGVSNAKKFIKDNGFEQTSLGIPPKTTAFDVSLFFEKLYKGEIVNQQRSDKMMELFKKQELDNKLPKYLPEGTVVAHKTGEINYFSHDAGIVFGEKTDYIIVVLSESTNPAGAEDRIGKISKAVFDYFEK